MKQSSGRRNRKFAKQAKKRRQTRRPRLLAEHLESRLLLASDFDYSAHREFMDSDEFDGYTNIIDAHDVDNSGSFNVADPMHLINQARKLKELTGGVSYKFGETRLTQAVGEGDGQSESIFVDARGERVFADTNSDERFDVRDILDTIRQFRAEGESHELAAFSYLLYEADNPAFIQNDTGDMTVGQPNPGKVEINTFTVNQSANLTVNVEDLRNVAEPGVGAAFVDIAFESGFPLSVTTRTGAFDNGAFVFNAQESTDFLQDGDVFPNFTNPLGVTDLGTGDLNISAIIEPVWEMVDMSLNIGGARLVATSDMEGVVQGQSVTIDVLSNDTLDDVFTVVGSEPSKGGGERVGNQEITEDGTLLFHDASPAFPDEIDYGTRDFQVLDPSGNALTKQLGNITQGSKGTASIDDNGTPNDPTDDRIVYTANANESGTDTFTYELTDGFTTQVGTVTVEIGEVNDPPVVSADSPIVTNENTAVALTNVSVNDPDAEAGVMSFTLTSTSGNLSLASTTNLTNVNGNGSTSLSFDGTQADGNAALSGLTYTPIGEFSGSDTVTVTVNDNGNTGVGGAETGSTTIDVTVNAVNDPPVNTLPAGPLLVFNTDTLTINGVSISDIDAGSGSVDVTLSVSNGSLMLNSTTGLTVSNNNGTITASGTVADLDAALSQGVIYDPVDNFVGADTLTFNSNDNGNTGGPAETDSASVQIDVTPPTLPFAAPDALTVAEDSMSGAANQIDAFANDLNGDVERGGADLNLDSFTQPANGVVTHLGSGVFEYIPDPDFYGDDTFTYTISDSTNTPNDGPDTGTVSITVNPVNDAPDLTAPGTATTAEDTLVGFTNGSTISITDIDAESGSLTVTLSSTNGVMNIDPNGATASSTTGSTITLDGTLSQLNAALGTLTYDPNLNFNGAATLTVNVNDNGNTGPIAESDSETIDITVTPVNDAPVINLPSQDLFTTKGFSFTFDADAPLTFEDVDSGSGDLTVMIDISTTAAGNLGSITLGNPGDVNVTSQTATSITFEGTLSEINSAVDGLTYTPGDDDFVGDVVVDVNVNDNGNSGDLGAMSDSDSVTIEVLDFIPSTLSGHVFLDGDRDSEKDGVELGFAAMTVTLTGTDITGTNLSLTTQTDSDGFYSFDNLAPPMQTTSGYTISIEREEAILYNDSTDYIGSQGGTASDNSLHVPTSAFIVNGQPLGGVTGLGNNFTFLGVDVRYVNVLQFMIASSQGENGQVDRLLLSVDSSGNATSWVNMGGWSDVDDFSVFNVNAHGTQGTLRAVNGSTLDEVLNFPVIRDLGDDGQGNTLYWIEGSYDDLFSQAGQSEGEGEAAEAIDMERDAQIEMLAAALEQAGGEDFEQAVDEVFAGEDLA